MNHKKLRQLVTQAAARQLPSLPPGERANLIEGIALLLADTRQKDLAHHTVGLIRQAEEHQSQLFRHLTAADPSVTLPPRPAKRKSTRQLSPTPSTAQ
jgi:hypothetical protein